MNNSFIITYNYIINNDYRFFKKYVLSEINHTNKHTKDLFSYLFSKKNTSSIGDKYAIFNHIYGDTPYDDLLFRRLLSESKAVMEDYIAFRAILKDKSLHMKSIAEYYTTQNDYNNTEKTLSRYRAYIEKQALRNESYYDALYFINYNEYIAQQQNDRRSSMKYKPVIEQIMHKNMIQIIKNICIYLTEQQFEEDEDLECYTSYIQSIQEPMYAHNKVLQLYYQLYLMLSTHEQVYFFYIKNYISKFYHTIDTREAQDIYLIILNYAIRNFNSGDMTFGLHALEIYDEGLDKGCLLANNIVDKFLFTNYCTIAIKAEKLDKAETFIRQYSPLLQPSTLEDTIRYNTIRLLFAKKNYKQSWELIHNYLPKDIFWELNSKTIALKILYETNEEHLFDHYVNNFYTYVKRKNNVGYHKAYFTKIAASFKFLSAIYNKSDSKIRAKILQLQENNEPEKVWFSEKLSVYVK